MGVECLDRFFARISTLCFGGVVAFEQLFHDQGLKKDCNVSDGIPVGELLGIRFPPILSSFIPCELPTGVLPVVRAIRLP